MNDILCLRRFATLGGCPSNAAAIFCASLHMNTIHEPIDIMLVLGSQNDLSGKLSAMAVERTRGALREYRKRSGAKLLLTSSYGPFNKSKHPHSLYMAQYLISQGVDVDDILPQENNGSTLLSSEVALSSTESYSWARQKPPNNCLH